MASWLHNRDTFNHCEIVSLGKTRHFVYMDVDECTRMYIFEDREVLVKWPGYKGYMRVPAIMLTIEKYDWFKYITP